MAVICAAAELQFWDDLHDINEALAPNIAKVMFQSHAHSCLLLEVTIVLACCMLCATSNFSILVPLASRVLQCR